MRLFTRASQVLKKRFYGWIKKLSEEFGECFGEIEDVVEYVRKIREEEDF